MGAHVDHISLGEPGIATLALHWFIFGFILLITLGMLGGGIAILDQSLLGGSLLAAAGVGATAFAERVRRQHMREIHEGSVGFDGSRVIIDHPPLFKDVPLSIAVADIRVMATEGTTESQLIRERHGLEPHDTFPIFGDEGTPLERHVRGHVGGFNGIPGPLPFRRLGRNSKRANAVLLFERPVVTPPLRHSPAHGPQKDEALGALAFRAPDPELVRDLFRRAGVRSTIREADIEHLARIEAGDLSPPETSSVTRQEADLRQRVSAGWGLLLLGVMFPPLELVAVPSAVLGWRSGSRLQALAMAGLAFAMFTLHLVAYRDGEIPTWRVILGVVATVLFLTLEALFARGEPEPG